MVKALQEGVLAGFPVVGVKAVLYDGSFHDVDSSEEAFKIAGSLALKEAVKRADTVLLEPIMKLEVTTPEGFMGDIIGDLSSKRARIEGTESRGNVRIIDAQVPLAEMFGYATKVRSQTQGRASFSMEPSHYEEIPKNVASTIIHKDSYKW